MRSIRPSTRLGLAALLLAAVGLLVHLVGSREHDEPSDKTPFERRDLASGEGLPAYRSTRPDDRAASEAEQAPPMSRPHADSERVPERREGGTVFGVVTDSRGDPVPGATVSLTDARDHRYPVVADGDARYRIDHVASGVARLEAHGPEPSDGFASGAIELDRGSAVPWDPVLETKHAIFGTVVDDAGFALPGVEVSARWRGRRRSATTGPEGRFAIHPCRDEPHELVAVGLSTVYHEPSTSPSRVVRDHDGSPRIVTVDSVRPGPEPVLVRFSRERSRTTVIAGRLVASDDRSPTDFQVRVVFDELLTDLDSFGNPTCEVIRPNADGTFRSRPAVAGRYRVWVETPESIHPWEASRVATEPGTVHDLGDLHVPVPGAIEVRIVGGSSADETLGLSLATILDNATETVFGPDEVTRFEAAESSGDDRLFRFVDVFPGPYVLTCTPLRKNPYAGDVVVTVHPGETTRHRWTVRSEPWIYWRLFESGAKPPSNEIDIDIVTRKGAEPVPGDGVGGSTHDGSPFSFLFRLPRDAYRFDVETDTGYRAIGEFDIGSLARDTDIIEIQTLLR